MPDSDKTQSQILAAAAEALAAVRQDWELHVYSSLNIYGWHEQDRQFAPLYDALKKNPCVVYHGSRPNAEVRQAVLDSHVFVYPSIYQETSCMALQEAAMAGNLIITSSLGALIETAADWAWMLPFTERADALAQYTFEAMQRALNVYDNEWIQSVLWAQSQYFQNFYAFETRVPAWKHLLEAVIKEGVPEEKLIIE